MMFSKCGVSEVDTSYNAREVCSSVRVRKMNSKNEWRIEEVQFFKRGKGLHGRMY